MFNLHYKLEAPKGLTEEQLEFWNEAFVPALKGVNSIKVELGERGPPRLELIFAPKFREQAYVAGSWFVTKLMMDPETKDTGPLWNNVGNMPRLITATSEFPFYVADVDAASNRIELLLYPTLPVSQ